MRVEQHLRTMRLGHLAIGDRVDQRPAVGLTSKVEHPAHHPRAGRAFSRQVRLRRVCRRTPQDLVPLLEQADPLAQLTVLRGLRPGLTAHGTRRFGGTYDEDPQTRVRQLRAGGPASGPTLGG